MRKKIIVALLIFVAVCTAWCFHRRLFQDDEKRIREIIGELEVAAEARNTGEFMKHVSGNYTDDRGHKKMVVHQMVNRVFQSVSEIKVNISDIDVVVTGEKAWAIITVSTEAVKGGKIIAPFGSDERPETPRITFEKTSNGDWEIIKIDDVDGSY
jgi:hypothetical protein